MKATTHITDVVCVSNPSAKTLALVETLRQRKFSKVEELRKKKDVYFSKKD